MAKRSEKIAVVSGGTGALGKAVVEQFVKTGISVTVTHTGNKQSVEYVSALQHQGLHVKGLVVDVTSEHSVEKFYNEFFLNNERIDILCNLVGGVSPKQYIEDLPFEEWNKMLAINLNSCFLMMRGALREMKNNGFGRIINIAAMPGVTPEAKRGGYAVSKSGVIALTKMAAEEVKAFNNITVNAIAPSIIVTEENKTWGTPEELATWVTPEQIADMIAVLCSDTGGAINGQIIHMYGKV